MKLPHFCSVLCLITATVSTGLANAQTTAEYKESRPLNLSLPREAAWTSTVRQDNSPQGQTGFEQRPPGPGSSTRDSGNGNRFPYGSGYEARQRENGGNGGRMSGGGFHGRGGRVR